VSLGVLELSGRGSGFFVKITHSGDEFVSRPP
jgi:hypothetical protein